MDMSLTPCGAKGKSASFNPPCFYSAHCETGLSLNYQQSICGEHQPGRLQEGSAEDALPATSEEVHFYTAVIEFIVTSSITICCESQRKRAASHHLCREVDLSVPSCLCRILCCLQYLLCLFSLCVLFLWGFHMLYRWWFHLNLACPE